MKDKVKVIKKRERRKTISLRLPSEQIKEMDAVAKISQVTRTDLIEHAINKFLGIKNV